MAGKPSSGQIANIPGMFLCQRLIQLLHKGNLKIIGQSNHVNNFE